MKKVRKEILKLGEMIVQMYFDDKISEKDFNILFAQRCKALTFCEVSRSKRFDKQDLLRAYQAGSIENQEDSIVFGYTDLKELTENSEKWCKRYTK